MSEGPRESSRRVGQHQVVKCLAQALAAQLDARGLRLDHPVILLNRDRRRAHVHADFTARGGQGPSRGREGKGVVVPHHALDFQQLLLAKLVEHGFQHGKREHQLLVQGFQGTRAMQPQIAQEQVGDHGARNSQVFDAIRQDGPGFLQLGLFQRGMGCGHRDRGPENCNIQESGLPANTPLVNL